jgi:hypothetical protein
MRYSKQGILTVPRVKINTGDLKKAVYLSHSCYNRNKTYTGTPVKIKNKPGGGKSHFI